MEKNKIMKLATFCLPLMLLASCGTKRQVISDGVNHKNVSRQEVKSIQTEQVRKLAFVQKVSDNQVYTKNITGSMNFTIRLGEKKISVDGALRMRKDEVIRLQLYAPILGFEIGRLEFTPDYVLIIDRYHKQYIKADYNQVDFLQKQGINFYSLQSLFWNQLLLPGAKQVKESDLKKFDASLDVAGDNVPVVLKNGNMTYVWTAQRATGRIEKADVEYVSSQHGTSGVHIRYADFRSVGVKQFPALLDMTLVTNATRVKQEANIVIKMNEVKTDSNWESRSEVSSKYKQVSVEDVLNKIMSL